jgi:predicted nucleic acid-binding protein
VAVVSTARVGGRVFLDTSVLLAGMIDIGPASAPSQRLLDLLARPRSPFRPATAWHCCLEFYAVSTRLPEEYRLDPAAAVELLESEVLGRMEICDLPGARRGPLLRRSAQAGVRGGRLYDAHIAEVAAGARSRWVVTDNVRHFASLETQGIRVLTSTAADRELSGGGN